jgi:3-phytase
MGRIIKIIRLLITVSFASIVFVPFVTGFSTGPPPGPPSTAGQVPITAAVETDPVPSDRDAADDPLIWIHPDDPSLSTVIGNDRKGAFEVYDLSGQRIQSIPVAAGNTDIRYNFPLGGERVALVAGFSYTSSGLVAWKVNPTTRQLEEVTAPSAPARAGGGAMYHSPVTGEYYWFSNNDGVLYQYRLFDDGLGRVASELVRTVPYGSGQAEGTVADDVHGVVYLSVEPSGLWRLPAEPGGGNEAVQVDRPAAQGGHFTPDLEGLTIYYRSDGGGYLFASSQGSDSFNIFERGGDNAYIATFTIQDGVVDGISATDGIDVTNLPLGAAFPSGLFVAQDGSNTENGVKIHQNFKLVPFERIAGEFGLLMDTTWDPRAVGRQAASRLQSSDPCGRSEGHLLVDYPR